MTPQELEALSATMAAVVQEHIDAATRPLIERLVHLEAKTVTVDVSDGKDGVGLAGALIDRDGNLVITLTNGETKNLGPVVGRDGNPGLGFEDMTEELADDGRTIIRRYARGEQVKEFRHSLPVVIDRGVYKDGGTYEQGDGVTWAGSFWIAQQKTTEKPDSGNGWRLAVKRGRDGKSVPTATALAKTPIRVGVPSKGE